jgi:hypothetical protein
MRGKWYVLYIYTDDLTDLSLTYSSQLSRRYMIDTTSIATLSQVIS